MKTMAGTLSVMRFDFFVLACYTPSLAKNINGMEKALLQKVRG